IAKKEVNLNNHDDAVAYLIEELFNNKVIESVEEISGVGHRVVHGGAKYATSVIVNDKVIDDLEELCSLAPLHNPANISGIRAFKKIIPNAVAVAVFDTAFHQTMEEHNYLYATPYDWYTNYGVRKYGFHGTSHNYLDNRMSEILDSLENKIITCHLGNGGSVSAIKNGKCINTSMGFTPNAGILMGSRSGDIDSSLIPYVMEKTNKSIEEISNDLNKSSGLLGISGLSSDHRDIEDGIEDENARCILAQKMYVKSIVDYIARYYVELNGVDAICFSGGIGENSSKVRKEIMESLAVLGIKIDEQANNVRGKEALISLPDSSVACYVVPTDEEVMIARATFDFAR
ncbi:MAG: acetate kinase, partial [Burkholderiales bacterium]|nr:acetate kinase [Burkholderiales bacterium]